MRSILLHGKWFFFNIITCVVNLFIKRRNNIWLFGSWMGKRYADNSRYLYDFLSLNKEKYDIKKVVWVTNDMEILNELKSLNFEVYKTTSFKGIYYHFKSGNHVICNMPDKTGKYTGDIYGRFSFGSNKIQLWHGLGIKAVGNKRNGIKCTENYFLKNIKTILDKSIFTPGGWGNCFWLVTSQLSKKIAIEDNGVRDVNNLIMANYPRFCYKAHLILREKEIINEVIQIKNYYKKIVFYLPTFRDNYDLFVNPTSDSDFILFLKKNRILWLEKKHLASAFEAKKIKSSNNIVFLDPDIDVNIFFSLIDELITDYSSVSVDAIVQNKKVINYIPDFDYYKNDDRGFLADFELCNPGIHAKTLKELEEALLMNNEEYFDIERKKKYIDTKNFFIENQNYDIEWIFEEIIKVINQDK